ncbi:MULTISPECIES: FKBP-type peptidyl-prolyl cis-trans isomerase [Desulfosediminicola]|uniref:FKBP-type peptidyl-prolyl cis-trans isomerase n=1 Tax=Desulfosediminicola TaxID=2886823 RepID=UPI0010AC21F4|nr:FKBP-type peptidyl-prolyl cis-trans isomerase [Desulfosediminicola ganghwensis]
MKIDTNDIVTLAFIGKLENGTEFMKVSEDKPIQVTIGNSELPPTVENALVGLEVGQSRTVRVTSEEGFGPRMKNLLQTINNKEFIQRINPKPGMVISLKVDRDGEEHQVPATVMEVNEGSVVVDYNHPLAGHNLTYEVSILNIQKPA